MEAVSRQRILSKSRDDLNYNEYEDDDAWYDLDTLIKEHIHEIRRKWDQIDDGIWAKAIVFEKNRRVAKAYVRPPILTINGMDTGFDGHKIGLRGFDNPMRDAKTDDILSRYVGQGVKVRMDDKGNIEVKRLTQSNVYIKPLGEENAINDDLIKSSNMALEMGKQMVFDIKKFEQNVNKEMRRPYPNRAKLEAQCIVALTFAKSLNILQCPSWVIIINIVALDMLRNKIPIGFSNAKVPNIKNRPQLPVPEEDPYSLTGGIGSSTSSGGSSGKNNSKDKPPKLPPRANPANKSSKGDYDSVDDSIFRRFRIPRKINAKEKERDDPYYCGLRARVPNFPKSKSKDKPEIVKGPQQLYPAPPQMPPSMIHSRSFDSGMDSDFTESPYAHIYGRLPMPHRGAYMNPHLHPSRLYNQWE